MKLVEILVKLEENEIPNNTKFKWRDRLIINKKGTLYCDDVYFSKILNFGNAEALKEEVEIIEEDKQIKKFEINYAGFVEEKIFYEEGDKTNHCIIDNAGTELLINKINEIIDKVNKLKFDRE